MRLGALFLALALAAPTAGAQAPPPGPGPAPPAPPRVPPSPQRGPVRQLPQLITEAAAAETAYRDALEARLGIQSNYLNLKQSHMDLVSKHKELVAQGAPRGKLQEIQAQLATVSNPLARAGHALEDARAEELVRRLAAIRANLAVADRAFEKADEPPAPGRQPDIKGHIELANRYLSDAEKLRARGEEPTAAEEPTPLDPAGLEPEQLRLELAEFQEYAERAEERVAELEPDRAQLERSVAHLGRWRARLPHQADLPVRLERAQQELDRLNSVIAKERERAARHRQHVQALEAELGKRIREEGEPPR